MCFVMRVPLRVVLPGRWNICSDRIPSARTNLQQTVRVCLYVYFLQESEDDGKLAVGRFVDIYHSGQKQRSARLVEDTNDEEKHRTFCIARGMLDVVGEEVTQNVPLKGLVVPENCLEITLHAVREGEENGDRLLAHHTEGMALLLKNPTNKANKVCKEKDLAHDHDSIRDEKDKATVW